MNDAHLVLVLGCHRSGTSLAAASLRCLGAETGEAASWSAPDNPKGFFEHRGFLAFDNWLLHELGHAWDDPAPLDGALRLFDKLNVRAQEARTTVLAALLGEFRRHPVFALKEPRICRLLPFWRPLIESIGCRVSVVHAVRHPGAVVRSLYRRNRIPPERGFALWLAHIQAVRRDVAPAWPSVTVDYENLMCLPANEVRRIGAALALPVDNDELRSFVAGGIDDALHHETGDAIDLPAEVAVLWEQLKGEAAS